MSDMNSTARHPHIPAEAYCGRPFRVQHKDPRYVLADWDLFRAAGFEVRDMQPVGDPFEGTLRNGFTARWPGEAVQG